MIDAASYLAVNDYEARLLCERTGLTLADDRAPRRRGDRDARRRRLAHPRRTARRSRFPPLPPTALVDPTGCGDAYRAGLLYGIAQRWDWERTGRLAAMLGAIKIGSRGGQNHGADRDAIAARYHGAFGEYPW